MSRQNFNYLISQAAERAQLGNVHPHMLRRSCGHALAEKGADTPPDAGLAGPPRHPPYRALLPNLQQALRRSVALTRAAPSPRPPYP